MVLSSSILLAASNLQTLSTMACTNASLLMILQSLPPYMRQLRAAVEEAVLGPPIPANFGANHQWSLSNPSDEWGYGLVHRGER
jgi:hypothetical protein